MAKVVTAGLTHVATFKTEKPDFFNFALNSKILVNPEDSGFGFFPIIIAGLEPRDIIRVSIFAGEKEAEIKAFFGISGDCEKINKQAQDTLDRFVKSMKEAGYISEPIEFVKMDPMSGMPVK